MVKRKRVTETTKGELIELSSREYTVTLETPIFVSSDLVLPMNCEYTARYAYKVERGRDRNEYRKTDGKRLWALPTCVGWILLDSCLASKRG
jgi:hypothetical protein